MMKTVRNQRVESVDSNTRYIDCQIMPGTYVNVEGSIFRFCEINGSKFEKATSCVFDGCLMSGNVLQGANLNESVFFCSDIDFNDFSNASVFSSEFVGNRCRSNKLTCLNYSVDEPMAIADLCRSYLS